MDEHVGPEIPDGDRTLALVAHALTFVEGGILGPLVLYLVGKDQSEFVAFHGLQSLYFGLAFLLVGALTGVVTCGLSLAVLAPAYIVFEILACVEAYKGNWYRLPLVGDYAYEQHHP